MQVSAISGYTNQRVNNNIQFQGKKDKREINTPPHSNPFKAIPLAVLLAMSPLNIQPASAQKESAEVTTELMAKKDSVIEILHVKDACFKRSGNEDVVVEAINRDKSEPGIDCIRLVIKGYDGSDNDMLIYPKSLVKYVVETIHDNSKKPEFKVYGLITGACFMRTPSGEYKQKEDFGFMITNSFYRDLQEFLGESIDYSTVLRKKDLSDKNKK